MTGVQLARSNGGVALWRQIAQILEREIQGGEIGPGQRLSTEFELAARFSVNRHTVRRALAELEESGVIRVEQGRGTFVQEQIIEYPVSQQTSFTENLSRQSRHPNRELVRCLELRADVTVARALEIPVDAPVLQLTTAGEADGHRINVASHHFPLPRFSGIERAFRETGSLTAAFKTLETEYRRKITSVTARMPTVEDAEHLRQLRNRPVLVSESINVDPQGRPVEYVVTRFASDWVKLVFEP